MYASYVKNPQGFKFKPSISSVVGLDLSLRGTGFAVITDTKLVYYSGWTEGKTLQKKNQKTLSWFKMDKNTELEQQRRMNILSTWITTLISMLVFRGHDVTVAVEGYAHSQNSRAMSGLHELGGIIKNEVYKMCIPLRIYDPKSLKLAWCDDGSATKDEMIAAAKHYFDVDLVREESAADNLADAILIAGLADIEVRAKKGYLKLEDLDGGLRRVLMRVTDKNEEALITRPFILHDHKNKRGPIYATNHP